MRMRKKKNIDDEERSDKESDHGGDFDHDPNEESKQDEGVEKNEDFPDR